MTADTFQLEHFDKLLRGLEVAREAYENLDKDRHNQRTGFLEQRDRLYGELEELRRQVAELGPLAELAAFVLDVDRGIRTVDELITYTKERYT